MSRELCGLGALASTECRGEATSLPVPPLLEVPHKRSSRVPARGKTELQELRGDIAQVFWSALRETPGWKALLVVESPRRPHVGGLPSVPLLGALTADRGTCVWSASLTQVTDNCFVCLLLAEIARRPRDQNGSIM